MRRTVTILTTFLILWTSAVYAVNPNETSATQGLYENENGPGGNGPGRSPALGRFFPRPILQLIG